ncbi:nuclease [Aquirufa ecclesiirivi]|uniref:nuclease n=1 Tax=Aquirufa ecclesiirivi TaxID=2715124 RepID=UPI00140735D4|nr:nuclease [Aquirufa ecclesiirivi]NHC48055.1 nuclease [Aquirufa ecclesiirivi]
MNQALKLPPKSVILLTKPEELIQKFSVLIGNEFKITGKTRTDGSNIRKLIASTLEKLILPEAAEKDSFEIVPPKGKGVPKITREFIDTYIVTSGDSYNLQVWNRLPASNTLLIKFDSGESLKCTDVRFVFLRIDLTKSTIASVVILTTEYIEKNFGKFGKPTIKHQLLISSKARKSIFESADKVLSYPDSKKLSYNITHHYTPPKLGMVEDPHIKELYSIALLKELVAKKLIGRKLDAAATKNRGQALERMVLELLGYNIKENELLYGAYPDIRNQLLEVKVQDSPTVDLGRFSPEREEFVIEEKNLTTFDVRYLIALTNPKTEIIEGIILTPGERLGDIFSFVSSESYKCQRNIPMSFFEKHYGKAVFNPA